MLPLLKPKVQERLFFYYVMWSRYSDSRVNLVERLVEAFLFVAFPEPCSPPILQSFLRRMHAYLCISTEAGQGVPE